MRNEIPLGCKFSPLSLKGAYWEKGETSLELAPPKMVW